MSLMWADACRTTQQSLAIIRPKACDLYEGDRRERLKTWALRGLHPSSTLPAVWLWVTSPGLSFHVCKMRILMAVATVLSCTGD